MWSPAVKGPLQASESNASTKAKNFKQAKHLKQTKQLKQAKQRKQAKQFNGKQGERKQGNQP